MMNKPVKRSDNRWQIQLTIASKRVTLYGQTEREVREKARTALDGQAVAPVVEDITLQDLLDLFLANGQNRWKTRTLVEYQHYAARIGVKWGQLKVGAITVRTIAAILGGGLSPRVALYHYSTLHRAFHLGIALKLCATNPCDRAIAPVYQPRVRPIWTVVQARRFLLESREDALFPLFHLALHTGLRIGELLGLQWGDVDVVQGTVTVQRTLCQVNGQFADETPKTLHSRRVVAIAEETIRILQVLDQGDQLGVRIFQTKHATPLGRQNVNRTLKRLCLAAGVPVITMHSFRHLYASLALKGGAPLPLLSRTLGHSSVTVTTGIYAHAMGDDGLVEDIVRHQLAEPSAPR